MANSTEKILSIIIPMYNMEKYISKCLNSLLIPDIDSLDVLVVNDGSKDKSSEIAHQYQEKYPLSFKVIDKENGNYGSCVNRGLKEAKGKYVKILDADDYFNSTELSNFIRKLHTIDVDCVISDYKRVDIKGKTIQVHHFNGISQGEIVPLSVVSDILPEKIAMHAVTYRLSIFHDLNYFQTEGISYTDMEWIFTPIAYSKTFFYIPNIVYCYLVGREGQTMDPAIRARYFNDIVTGIKRETSNLECIKDSIDEFQNKYLIKHLERRILASIPETIDVVDNRKEILKKLYIDYNERWCNLGIDLEFLTEIPVLKKSYVRDWRKLGFPLNYKKDLIYKIWLIIEKILKKFH